VGEPGAFNTRGPLKVVVAARTLAEARLIAVPVAVKLPIGAMSPMSPPRTPVPKLTVPVPALAMSGLFAPSIVLVKLMLVAPPPLVVMVTGAVNRTAVNAAAGPAIVTLAPSALALILPPKLTVFVAV